MSNWTPSVGSGMKLIKLEPLSPGSDGHVDHSYSKRSPTVDVGQQRVWNLKPIPIQNSTTTESKKMDQRQAWNLKNNVPKEPNVTGSWYQQYQPFQANHLQNVQSQPLLHSGGTTTMPVPGEAAAVDISLTTLPSTPCDQNPKKFKGWGYSIRGRGQGLQHRCRSPLLQPGTSIGMSSTGGETETEVSTSRETASTSSTFPPSTQQITTGITREKLQDLMKSINPTTELDEDVEDTLLEYADDFMASIMEGACAIAAYRKSKVLEVKDVQMYLERGCNLWMPGFGTEQTKRHKLIPVTREHQQKLALIRKTLKKKD